MKFPKKLNLQLRLSVAATATFSGTLTSSPSPRWRQTSCEVSESYSGEFGDQSGTDGGDDDMSSYVDG